MLFPTAIELTMNTGNEWRDMRFNYIEQKMAWKTDIFTKNKSQRICFTKNNTIHLILFVV